MFALDSLFVTIFLALLLICDIRNMERALIREEFMDDYEKADRVVPRNSFNELAELISDVDYTRYVDHIRHPVSKR